jgi:hypothetical protein
MAVIYLQHPQHGAKVAISEMEAENDIQNGWEEFDPAGLNVDAAPSTVVTDDDEPVEPPPVNELQTRRRGRRLREATQ